MWETWSIRLDGVPKLRIGSRTVESAQGSKAAQPARYPCRDAAV